MAETTCFLERESLIYVTYTNAVGGAIHI